MLKTVKVYIYQDDNCAWCDLNGQMIYAKSAEELQQWLDEMSACSKKQYELTEAVAPVVSCNNVA